MIFSTNIRAQLVDGQTLNQASDFTDIGFGPVTNSLVVDDLTHLVCSPNTSGKFQLSPGVIRLKHSHGRARCELTQAINVDMTGADGAYHAYILLDSDILLTGSATDDGSDVFTLGYAATLPTGAIELRTVTKAGSTITVSGDQRHQRSMALARVSLTEDLTVGGDLAVAGGVTIAGTLLETRLTSIESSLAGGGDTVEAILGEDMTAGDGQGAVFFGQGVMKTRYLSQKYNGTNLELGKDGDPTKIGFVFTTPPAQDHANILTQASFVIKKVGSPSDSIQRKLYEADKTTLVSGRTTQTIAGSALTTSYVTRLIDMQDVELTPDTPYFLEISRTGAQNSSNYYFFDSAAALFPGHGYSTNDSAVRTDSTSNLVFSLQYAYSYDVDKVRLADARYLATHQAIGKLLLSGSAGDTRLIALSGLVDQTSTPGQSYRLGTPSALAGTFSGAGARGWGGGAAPGTQTVSLIMSQDTEISSIAMGMNVGTFVADVSIQTDNAGSPSGTPVVAGSNLSYLNPTTTNAQFMTCDFPKRIMLQTGVQYWLIVSNFGGFSSGSDKQWLGRTLFAHNQFSAGGSDYVVGKPGTFGTTRIDGTPNYLTDLYVSTYQKTPPRLFGSGITSDTIRLRVQQPALSEYQVKPGAVAILSDTSAYAVPYTGVRTYIAGYNPAYPGIYIVTFTITGVPMAARIYVNGVPIGTYRSVWSGAATYSENIALQAGDALEIRGIGNYTATVSGILMQVQALPVFVSTPA